jgi:hypothetical protein
MIRPERRSGLSTPTPILMPTSTPARSRTSRHAAAALVLALALLPAACGGGDTPEPADEGTAATTARADTHDAFMDNVAALCGRAFRGAAELATSDAFDGEMIMHVRVCTEDEIQIPVHVEENRSRTWILTRTADGLRLKHDHRYPDGTEEQQTQYGGDTTEPGTQYRQSFPADAYTAELIPEAETNVWSMTIDPETNRFIYHLTRHGEPRATFVIDLSDEVPPPPPAWGYEGT